MPLTSSEGNSSDPFVWPPRSAPADVAPISPESALPNLPAEGTSPQSNATRWPHLQGLFVQIERQLLRPTIEPVERQASDLGWSRESREDSCDRCGRTVGPHEDDEFGCARCRGQVSPIDRVVRLGEYIEPLDRWIWALKFQRIRTFGRYLGRQVASSLKEAGALDGPPIGGVVVQSMPTSRRRSMARGIDHSRVIAEACAAELGIPSIRVLRSAHRRSQRSVPASERWLNAQGSFRVPARRQHLLLGRRVLLVDDVRTTGATGRAAALALRGQPDARYTPAAWGAAEVWHAVVASAE